MVPEIKLALFIHKIEESTTVAEFSEFCGSNIGDLLKKSAFNALSRAAIKGNSALISHFVSIEGQSLLNQQNKDGLTPLFFCIHKSTFREGELDIPVSKRAHLIIPTLICTLGGNVNLAISAALEETIRENATPLSLAAEKTNNIDLIRMLLIHGAVVPPSLSKKGQERIAQAQAQIAQEITNYKFFLLAKEDRAFELLPELINLIVRKSLALWYRNQVTRFLSDAS